MKILQGRVVGGRIVVEGDLPGEGEKVTIVTEGDEAPYRLSLEEEAALEEADAEISRGDFVTVAELLAEMRHARG
jgi:hypothetical protein